MATATAFDKVLPSCCAAELLCCARHQASVASVGDLLPTGTVANCPIKILRMHESASTNTHNHTDEHICTYIYIYNMYVCRYVFMHVCVLAFTMCDKYSNICCCLRTCKLPHALSHINKCIYMCVCFLFWLLFCITCICHWLMFIHFCYVCAISYSYEMCAIKLRLY